MDDESKPAGLLPFAEFRPDIPVRKGATFVASFDGSITELKIRHGRLTAKVDDMWHIIPNP